MKTRAFCPSRMKAGKDTSSLLIELGIALFGARGYDGVTARELARGARTNISSIKYHFGGKTDFTVRCLKRSFMRSPNLWGRCCWRFETVSPRPMAIGTC